MSICVCVWLPSNCFFVFFTVLFCFCFVLFCCFVFTKLFTTLKYLRIHHSPPKPFFQTYNLGPKPAHIGTHQNDGPCLRRRVGNGLGPRENIKLAACPGKFSAMSVCLASVLFVYHWQKFSGNFLCVYLLFLKSKL